MNTKKKNTGFSLTEILIAVAIIGILATVAMPSYMAYLKRAKALEVVTLYEVMKLHVVSYHLEKGIYPPSFSNLSKRNIEIGLGPTDSYETDVIKKAWVGTGGIKGGADEDSGHIAITYKDGDLHEPPNNRGGMFIATVEEVNGRYKWVCNNSTTGKWKSDMNHDFLPKNCRN